MRLNHEDPADTTLSTGSRASGPGSSRRLPWYAVVLVALLAAALVRAFLLETFFVPDRGMEPTLGAGDRVLVAKWTGAPARGDVVVADVTEAFHGVTRGSSVDDGLIGSLLSSVASALGIHTGAQSIAARVVAVGGDTVTCSAAGEVVVGGSAVSGPVGCEGLEVAVPAGSVWLLGDDPAHAIDSLSQADSGVHGLVPVDDVVGRVVLSLWPVGIVHPSPTAGDGS